MINYGKVQSTIRPEHIKHDDYSTWVHTDIVNTEDGYEYNMVQYSKDEYSQRQDKTPTAEERLVALEAAMLDVIMGGML